MAVGLGLVFWMFLLFSPLAWVGQVKADDAENYGTVIGIVSLCFARPCLLACLLLVANLLLFRIWAPPTLASV